MVGVVVYSGRKYNSGLCREEKMSFFEWIFVGLVVAVVVIVAYRLWAKGRWSIVKACANRPSPCAA